MLSKVKWPEDRSYRSGGEWEPFQFYLDALIASTKFDLLLGYFSSSAINILSLGFAKFISSGGSVRIIINDILSEQDKNAISEGTNSPLTTPPLDFTDFKSLKSTLDEYGKHFFECLSWLVAHNRIQIKIIKPKDGKGISHYKSGIFSDGNNKVGFKGSCNFTAYGLLENLEEVETYLSWENGRSSKFLINQGQYFENIFIGGADFVEYVDISEVQIALKNEFGGKDINELLVHEAELLAKKKSISAAKRIATALVNAEERVEEYISSPKFPFSGGPRDYQTEAYNKWIENDRRGLFAMATGTGKTLTSLNCILQDFTKHNYYKFLVLVPSISLANQWKEEVQEKFRFNNTIVCSSKSKNWSKDLRRLGQNLFLNNDKNYAVILTYSTFNSKKFKLIFEDLFKNEFNKLTLIADEAHTMGSAAFLKRLPNYIHSRIGLSATPERQFDEAGERAIHDFFNVSPPKYTYEFNMKQAIDKEILCKYFYYPKLVDLEKEELDQYTEISRKLAKFFDASTGRYQDNDYVNLLLIQRKNIIHKAKNKVATLNQIVKEIGPARFKKAFIYVPEGVDPDYTLTDEAIDQDSINENLINIYTTSLYDNFKLRLKKFTGKTQDREVIVAQFKDDKIDALLAMKCLDEGIDIPSAQYAIFCSSTGNPRQFVQRRGRVLRRSPGKDFAIIYDMIVKPTLDITSSDESLKRVEKNIFLNELRRFINFAVLAENNSDCLKELEEICYSLDIDIYALEKEELQRYNNSI